MLKAHVFDHQTGKVACNSRFQRDLGPPNKRRYSREDMLERHSAIHQRKGGPNPYKFCCKKCEEVLINMS